ncbi:MAG: sensor domain-containing diguanylate cyclase, partial [Candidatus Omnitrophica bacterium]|nr:sensor domain-containing diguanylate cyclase [Candidatus Omnitrophota bacterium]
RLGDLISTGTGYDEITAFAAEKISGEMEKAFCVIYSREQNGAYVMKSFYNASRKDIPVEDISREIQLVDKLFSKNECLLMDSRPLTAQWQRDLRDKLGIKNVLIYPMKDNTRLLGAIVTGGSYDEIRFDDEEIGVLRAYAKELVLAHQSSQVFERVKSLDVVDSLTGLYTRAYLEDRLEDEINRAVFYQRPCSILVMNIDDFEKYAEREGVQKSKKLLKQLAQFLTAMSMPVGKVARFDYDEFGILLPERNKRESIEIAEDIRRRVSSMDISADPADGITVSIGVGENPIDGTNAKEIIAKAYRNMQRAKESGKNRVVGE